MARRSDKRITKTVVDALKPGQTAWDTEVKGFGCRCQAKGRFYILKYRTTSGRQRWYTIGEHGSWTPDGALRKARDLKKEINDGGDPSGDKKQKRIENTISELADRYVREHVEHHNKPSTAREIKRIVEKRMKPEIGHFKITELTRSDLKKWHQSMSAIPSEANRCLAYCSKMLSLAHKEWEFRSDNPCIGIQRFPEKARERFFSDEEMKAIGKALADFADKEIPRTGFVLLVQLLAATGMRVSEGLNLTWTDVDLPACAIRIQDAKAGARTVHLSADTVAMLDARKKKEGYVITNGKDRAQLPISIVEMKWKKIRKLASIKDARLHDLRHTYGTYAALSGANAFVVRDLLGHKTLEMTNRYVERAAEMVKATVNSVSVRISSAMKVENEESAEIVQ